MEEECGITGERLTPRREASRDRGVEVRRMTVSIPDDLVAEIDRAVMSTGFYSDRGDFVECAVKRTIMRMVEGGLAVNEMRNRSRRCCSDRLVGTPRTDIEI